MKRGKLLDIIVLWVVIGLPVGLQARQRGAAPASTLSPKAGAPVDLTGYWVALVTEDWRWRMMTPPKGDFQSLPLNAEGRRVGGEWDPAKDQAAGEQCKAFGAGGIMRVPARLNITWDTDSTLKVDIDAGTQTRLFHFDAAAPQTAEPSWQGQSTAQWEFAGGRGVAAGRPGSLKVVTTRMRSGYLRKNGAPYSDSAVMTEYLHRMTDANGDSLLVVLTIINDSRYLTQPMVTSTQFKKLSGVSGWNPTPCSAQ